MKLLILTIEYPPLGGGASPVIHAINKEFVAMGHEVTVITMAHKHTANRETIDGIEIYRIHSFRVHKHISYLWEHLAFVVAARRFLKKLLAKESFDFCFTHFLVPTGILARWLQRSYGIPYAITAHGSDIPGFNPDRFYHTHRFTPPLIRSIMNHSHRIISPSTYLIALMQGLEGVPSEKIVHIPNGIDTAYFKPGIKKPIILATGRLLERKGFQHLIEAVADEPLPLEIHICGDGPMKKSLQDQAQHSQTPIKFHGWLDNRSEAYRILLAEASIFCLVSARENASIALLEALASGCAVITSNVSGCPESVGDAGICITPGDVQALKAAIRRLLTDTDYRTHLRNTGRQRAIERFAWPSIATAYLSQVDQARSQ